VGRACQSSREGSHAGDHDKVGFIPHWCKGCWLFVIFGDHQVMAQLIAKRVLIALLINKDFQFATRSSLVAMLLP
jgi:hypothetical protein